MKSFHSVVLASAASLLAFLNSAEGQTLDKSTMQERPPNIVLLLGDDHGWPYFGFMGSERVLTPNLDMMARNGVLFTRGYSVAATCAPALRSLLTGFLPVQFDWIKDQLPEEMNRPRKALEGMPEKAQEKWSYAIESFPTIPRLLGEKGYRSFQGGKYWEGSYKTSGFTHGMSEEFTEETIEKYGFLTALAGGDGLSFGRESIDPLWEFIDEGDDEPFFVWFAPMLPHLPFDPPDTYTKYYQGDEYSDSAQNYYANCTRFDDKVGELYDGLEDRGMLENTLFIYINDNGWKQPPGEEHSTHAEYAALGGPTGKNSLFEFGFRTPVIFYWKDKLPSGVVEDDVTSMADIFPTILEYAGVGVPPHRPGRSLRPVIDGERTTRRTQVVNTMDHIRSGDDPWAPHEGRGYAITTRDWHYWLHEGAGLEWLVNRHEDIEEKVNLVEEHPEVVFELQREIAQWQNDAREQADKAAAMLLEQNDRDFED